MKAIVLGSALAVAASTGGCTQERDKLRVEKAQLTAENQKMADTLKSLESESAEANATLEEVQKGLESIRAQELNLTAAQVDSLRRFLAWNIQPENAEYAYDYYRDNCSTRIRDALDRVLGGAIRRYAERGNNIVHWSEFDRGGHFAALEAPDLLVGDVRDFLRSLR